MFFKYFYGNRNILQKFPKILKIFINILNILVILVNLHTTLLHVSSHCHERLNYDYIKRIYRKMEIIFQKIYRYKRNAVTLARFNILRPYFVHI
jgi:hypothetical protein